MAGWSIKAGTIRVHASNHAGHVTETTKTEAGERTVPLFPSAREVRRAQDPHRLRPRHRLRLWACRRYTNGAGYVVRREFKPALEAAKLTTFRFHDLRHFAGSALIAQGADIKLLQAIAGHSSATTTLDVYGHLMTDWIREAAGKCDALNPKLAASGRREVDGEMLAQAAEFV